MQKWDTIDTATAPDGSQFVLARRGHEWAVRVNNQLLMSSRMHDSEIALASCALEKRPNPQRVLIGGLGLGYTLRAVLDRVNDSAEVVVAEIVPKLVEWNRQHCGALSEDALEDPRSAVVLGDVYDILLATEEPYDALLLDVDNGPQAMAQSDNQRLYGRSGLRACRAALRPGGVLAVWSAGPNSGYQRRLEAAGFRAEVQRVAARTGKRGKHVIFLGTRK